MVALNSANKKGDTNGLLHQYRLGCSNNDFYYLIFKEPI